MRKSDFHYELPEELIAQRPAAERSASRLLHVSHAALQDLAMRDLPTLIAPGDLLVFNDTRVIPARLFARKESGGRVEILVERVLDDREFLAQLGFSKTPKPGSRIFVGDEPAFSVIDRDDDLFRLRYEGEGSVMAFLERAGRIPLPPYIHHVPDDADSERYQTLFARAPGAVAAPTAGLHFDETLLTALRDHGAQIATLTLHVGAGTFQPVRVDDLSLHRMHAERYEISASLCEAIAATKRAGKRVIAVGTTVTRALESAAAKGELTPHAGETRLFITPGFQFKAVDALVTNFHLPESTLLMLVCAFAGKERVLDAYRRAVRNRYRFFSYGDAMFLERA